MEATGARDGLTGSVFGVAFIAASPRRRLIGIVTARTTGTYVDKLIMRRLGWNPWIDSLRWLLAICLPRQTLLRQ
jgi:hypothetical protein